PPRPGPCCPCAEYTGGSGVADRSVKVRLEANVQGYVAGMRTAAKATEDFARRANEQGGKALDWIGNHRESVNDLSNMFLGAGAGLLALSAGAVKMSSDFDAAMDSV